MYHPSQRSPSAAAAAAAAPAPVALVMLLQPAFECHVPVAQDVQLRVDVRQLVQMVAGFVRVLAVDIVLAPELNHQRGTGLMLKEYRMVDFPCNPCVSF